MDKKIISETIRRTGRDSLIRSKTPTNHGRVCKIQKDGQLPSWENPVITEKGKSQNVFKDRQKNVQFYVNIML